MDKNDDTKKDYCFEVGGDYPNLIQIFSTEQCIKTCNDFPSLNGEFCYKQENEACKSDILDTNSKLMNVESRRKCDCPCPYKFYIDSSTHKKFCLSEFDTCTQEYSFYVQETRQCVYSCADTNYFKKTFKIIVWAHVPLVQIVFLKMNVNVQIIGIQVVILSTV